MKKEIKYTLLSFPFVYLLLMIAAIFISIIFDGGKCALAGPFSTAKECGFIGLIYTSFLNAYLMSVYFFPVYIVIPIITFFTTRHFRIKHQAVSVTQPDMAQQQPKQDMKGVIWAVVIIIILFVLYLWSNAVGFSTFNLFPKKSNMQYEQQVVNTPFDQNTNVPTPSQNQTLHPSQAQDETVDWKTYESDYGFKFKYPVDWYNNGSYFSPQKVEYLEIGSVKAPVSYNLIKFNEFDSSNVKYQIDNSKRNAIDSTAKIAGKDFNKYDLQDYGRYEGASAGRVLIYVSPELNLNGANYYLVFQWVEKPASSIIQGNDPSIFEKIVLSLKFY